MPAARVIENQTFTLIESEIVPVGDVIDLDKIDAVKAHCFVGAQFFADANGDAPATPGAGTVTIEILSINNDPVFESPPSDVIQAANPTTLDWAANTIRVKATPNGITVATHYRIVVTANET